MKITNFTVGRVLSDGNYGSKKLEVTVEITNHKETENISANRANIDTAYKIMESNKREIKEDLSDRFHRVNSSVQKLMLEIAKGERNGKGL